MKKILSILTVFPIVPTMALAQSYSAQGFITQFLAFANDTLIPVLIGIAFLFFTINVIRFFVIDGTTDDGRENAKNLAIYSVLAFVVLIVFWGVVNLFSNSLPFKGKTAPTPDYLKLQGKELTTPPSSKPTPPAPEPLGADGCPQGSRIDPISKTCNYE